MSLDPLSNEPLTLTELAAQEDELQLDRFDNNDAWALGLALVEEARRRELSVVIDINRSGQQLFHAARPGTAADNDTWIARKARVVTRFGHSSLYMGQLCRDAGTTLADKFEVSAEQYAAHGGAFPLIIRNVGPVGVVTASGLPQVQDHRLVTRVLGEFIRG